jgi:hypothetical protein
MPSGNSFSWPWQSAGLFPGAQAGGAFFHQRFQRDAVDQVHRVKHIALGLGHLLAFVVAHQAVDVHVAERHLAGEVLGHHDHPGHPEEDDHNRSPAHWR